MRRTFETNFLGSFLYVTSSLCITNAVVGVGPSDFQAQELVDRGTHLENRGNLNEALQSYEEASKILERTGLSHPLRLTNLNNVARVFLLLDQPADAAQVYREALASADAAGRKTVAFAIAEFNSSAILINANKPSEARGLFEASIADWKRLLQSQQTRLEAARELNGLLHLVRFPDFYRMLEPIRQLRLTTLESAPGGFSADVARALTDLGILNNHLGKASEAESFYSRAIGISRKVPLFQNEDLATGFINLAELLSRQGKIQESLALYQEIIKDLRSIVGPPGPYLALALHNLGVTLCNERDHVRDLPNLQEAVSIWEKLRLEARLAQGLHDLGVALCWREQFQEAEKCFNRSIGITIERLGTRSIALVPLYGSLGVCYCRRGDYLPADDAFFMAKHIASGVPVEAEPSGVEGVDLQAAICLSNQGRYAEAEEKLRDVLRESPEPQTPAQLENRADVLRLLGAVCSAQGKFTPAERFHKMSQGILEKLCGNKSPRLVENLQNLSRIYTSMRRDKEARESNERILRIREASNSDESGVARCTD